jgi:flagellar hook-associated protein 3 FlgL
MNLANSTDGNGRYIFGGYKTESAPFAQADGAYSGGTTNVTQQVDASRTMVIGHTGDKVFANLTSNAVPEPGGGTQEKNLFKMLDTLLMRLKHRLRAMMRQKLLPLQPSIKPAVV